MGIGLSRTKINGFILGATFLAMLCGCTKKKEDTNLSILHGFEKDDVKTWDPANAYDSVSLDLLPSVVESLYQYNYLLENYEIEPLLAEGMPKYSKDRLTMTLSIKKGVRFQDDPCFQATQGKGRELKAQDFVYGFKRLALPSLESQGWWIADGRIVGMNAFHDKLLKASQEDLPKVFEEEVEGIKAIDDYTLQFKFLKPYPQFLYMLVMSFTSPVPREAVAKYADDKGNLLDHPVGTGPFVLTKWDRNHEIILDRNPNYRKEKYPNEASHSLKVLGYLEDAGKTMPFLDRIDIDIIKEAQPRWLNFMKGNLDFIPIPKDNFQQALIDHHHLTPELKQKGVKLSTQPGLVIRYIAFNMRDNVVGSNRYLRQALSSAIDREKWISIFTNGTGRKMVNAIPPRIMDRPKTSKIKYDFNLALAKELLKKAGYPEGQGLPPLKFDLRGASTSDRQLGDFIAQQFSQIGVKTEVIPNTFPSFLGKLKKGNLQVYLGGWSMDYPDAENIYQLFYGPNQSPGPGESNYDVPQFNDLYRQMSSLDPGPKRAELIQKMDDLLQEDCPWAFGYYEAAYDLAQPWLKNYRSSDVINNRFKYYRIQRGANP